MSSTPVVFKIVPTTQKYDWGKTGRSSSVAQFAEASKIPGFVIDVGSPYAELWMGTHPKSPSRVLSSGEALSEYLAAHPTLMGTAIIQKFKDEGAGEGNLPFLFKVLSIEKALSIQTHPDKKTAQELHKQQPDIYKDPNHKPEMALALTPFQALCGFRPLPEIASFLSRTPELKALIPPSITSAFLSISSSSNPLGPEEKAALKNLFAALMTAPEDEVKAQLKGLLARYQSQTVTGADDKGDEEVIDLVKRISSQFPGDVGVFCAFVLNYVKLQPGEAIFLGAGEPHAYIYGECIECMANSDNVIRAGLTPKLRDIPNLVSGLTYAASPPTNHVVNPKPFLSTSASSSAAVSSSVEPTEASLSSSLAKLSTNASTLYDPPIPEFSVVQVVLSSGGQKEPHRAVDGPSVVVVTQGAGVVKWTGEQREEELAIGTGDVFFVGADIGVEFVSDTGGLVLYRAFVEA